MTQLIDPSRYVGRPVRFLGRDGDVSATVVAVGSGGVLIHSADGDHLVVPADLHRLHVPVTI